MRCVIYRSKPVASFKLDEIAKIINQSRWQNPLHGITGALLYDGKHFVQIIEGPDQSIGDLFRNIAADPRHTNVEILLDVQVETRSFKTWAMGYAYADLGQALQDLPVGIDSFDRMLKLIARVDVM